MNVARLGIRTRTRTFAGRLADLRFRPALRRLAKGKPGEYREYLDVQHRRTLSKRANDPGAGARLLVRRVVELGGLSPTSSVLCVGCRNTVELDLFKDAGVRDVIGIDLVSQSPEIVVMDMHDMTFPDDRFDAVYASHALEHAYDVPTVVSEIARVGRPGALVGIEVPLGEGRSDADRIAFHGLDELRDAVTPIAGSELWADEQPASTPTNSQGTPVARIVFSLPGSVR
jgi:SAM-dependent methyltransferase